MIPFSLSIPLTALVVVFFLIAIRQIGGVRVQIWQAMLGGALAVILAGELTAAEALASVDMDVMLFLSGMFIVGQALEESGYLAHISYKFFKRARTRDQLVLMIIFGGGIASALLMNDTLAVIGTPVVLLLARKHQMSPTPLLLALAFGITTGSVMSPIGNPQNLLIALASGIPDPFITFLLRLGVPTLLSLVLCFAAVRLSFPDDFHDSDLRHSQEPIRDRQLAFLARLALQITILLVAVKTLTATLGTAREFRLTYIAIAAALPVVVGSPRRWRILRHVDWQTLVFFAALFILMESVWRTGFFQQLLQRWSADIRSVEGILGFSVLFSQAISNVPLVALSLPLLREITADPTAYMALAAGSTIAGNLFILGAASNVIVIQNAEKRGTTGISFLGFARVGIPLTIMQVAAYWLFLRLVSP
jgi:Na+/H+ antiporter NhaD/arsenite permease-like protein